MTPTPAIHYRIAPLDPYAHLFEVRCKISTPDSSGQRFRLPSWIPGSYLIREFARHVVRVSAEADGQPIAFTKEAKDVWRAAPCAGTLTIVMHIYAFDLSVRAAYLDSRRGYFNGSAVFPCPDGLADRPCVLEIAAPESASQAPWRVATTLTPVDIDARGFGMYRATGYDELIDHPVEMSDFALVSFDAGGARHSVAVSGSHRADLDRVARDLACVCQWQCDLFGGMPQSRAPFDAYLFLVLATADGYGGLEHRTSTSLICKRDELPQPGQSKVTADYRRFLGLASHEYFHSWLVKRIKPASFVPYDLAREGYTRQLWAFEGITSYYDDLALVRSGVIDRSSYLELLGRAITQLLRTPGRHVQSIAESSFDAWIKFYRQDENTPNAVISYYVKGSLVAMMLDLTLRQRGASLDELMRLLWQRFGIMGQGVPEDAIPALCNELANTDLTGFFARYVNGTDELPLREMFADVGITLHLRAQESPSDAGGTQGKAADDGAPAVSIGAKVATAGEPKLQHVYSAGPAERAGLAAGDVLVALDGRRVTTGNLPKLLAGYRPGAPVAVHAFRRDDLMTAELVLDPAPHDTCWLAIDDNASSDALARRAKWLGSA